MDGSPAGSRRAVAAIVFTLSVIFISAVIPVTHWPAHAMLLVIVFVLQTLARIPLSFLARRMSLFLPVVSVFALSIPVTNGFQTGLETAASIFVRSTVSFFVLLWLVRAVPFPQLTAALVACGIPVIFVSMLQMMHRYFGIL